MVLSTHLNRISSEVEFMLYSEFINSGQSVFVNNATLRRAERRVKSSDTLNLQFTSGTTGAPKAAMLTHLNLINNGRLIGDMLETDKPRCGLLPASAFPLLWRAFGSGGRIRC